MRLLIIILALLLTTASGFAADKDTGKEPGKGPVPTEEKKDTGQVSVKEQKKPQWPRPYKPTEEISVDSTVPFPNDI